MSGHEYGPLLDYQITWRSGHIETIKAHQVLWPSSHPLFGEKPQPNPRVLIHGEINGKWQLILAADEADILSIRRVLPSAVQELP